MADDTMVAKVARALAYSAGARIVGPGQSAATREFGWKGDGAHFELYVEAHWKEHVHAAGFAISAMREPTEAMMDASFEQHRHVGRDIWHTMIDAALGEKTSPPE